MKAVKNNRIYTINETQRKSYAAQGFDIIDDTGNVLEHAAGKTVSYERYAALIAENTQLKAKIAELESEQEKPSKTSKKD